MKAVIQRVTSADVKVDGKTLGAIGQGFLILLGVHEDDTEAEADLLAKKVANLRVFEDAITFKIALMVVKYMHYMESQEY